MLLEAYNGVNEYTNTEPASLILEQAKLQMAHRQATTSF